MSLPNPYESPQVDENAEADAESEGANQEQLAAGERWGWLHTALFGVAAAYVLWLQRDMFVPVMDWQFLRFQILGVLVMGTMGACIGAIPLAIVRKFQGIPTFPRYFGHWLMLVAGTNFLVHQFNAWLSIQAIKAVLQKDDHWELVSDPQGTLPKIQLATQIAALIVPWLAVRYSRGDKDWQRFGWLWLSFQVAQIVLANVGFQENWPVLLANVLLGLLLAAAFSIAALTDLRRQRDQLHWVGVVWVVLVVLFYCASRLLRTMY